MDEATTSTTSNQQHPLDLPVLDPTEESLGIAAYLNDLPGFSAVSKARYSDFCVHEVGLDGRTAHLTSMEATIGGAESAAPSEATGDDDEASRKRKREEANVATTKTVAAAAVAVTTETDKNKPDWSQMQSELSNLLQDETCSQAAISFLQTPPPLDAKTSDLSKKCIELVPIPDKQRRRDLHQWIRDRLATIARADTVDREHDKKVVRLWHVQFERDMPNFKAFGGSERRSKKADKPKPPAGMKFIQFVLYKENMDTTTALSQLRRNSSHHQRPPNNKNSRNHHYSNNNLRVGFAGNKDKRGITAQWVTVPAQTPVATLLQQPRRSGGGGGGNTTTNGVALMRVGNFRYVKDDLRLGSLQGNRFEVVLRHVQVSDRRHLEAAANAIRCKGFVNYFGTQRFGKFHDTHLTGMQVVRGNFEAAIDIIMQPKPDEREDYAQARKVWQERFAKEGDRATLEREAATKVAKELGRFMNSEVAVLNSLAQNPLDYRRAFSCISKTMRMMFVHAFQSLLWNKVASFRIKQGLEVIPGDLVLDGEGAKQTPPKVVVVTAEDVASKRYALRDVVLPLVGSKTVNPENECGKMFETLMEEHGITIKMLKSLDDRDFSCPGDYRKLVCVPGDVEFSIVEYYDALQPLLETDLMKLTNVKVTFGKEDGKEMLTGMIVKFTLPSSSYATIFMRELMKRPTSSEFQREQKLDFTVAPQNDAAEKPVDSSA